MTKFKVGDKFIPRKPKGESVHLGRAHMKCECGNIIPKCWVLCEKCREAEDIEKYNKMPFEEYAGEPVTEFLNENIMKTETIKIYCERCNNECDEVFECEKVEERPADVDKMRRHITEKELKIAASQIGLKLGVLEYLIARVRKNQSKYDKELKTKAN